MLTATKVDNGHFKHSQKGSGNTVYDGEIENLPYPEHFDLDEAIESMFTNGYAIVPGVLNRAEVAELRNKIDNSGGPDEQYEVKNWCFNKQLAISFHTDPFYLRYIDAPGMIDILHAVIGENCVLTTGNTWVTGRGRKMGLHIDHLPVTLPEEILRDPRVRVPVYTCPAQYYLDDMTLDIGPTIVVPGSHRAGRGPNNESTWNGITPKAVMVKAGDVAIFRFDVWHGAAGNTSDRRRYIMQLTYGRRDWLPYIPLGLESQYSEAVRKAATEQQSRLLWNLGPRKVY